MPQEVEEKRLRRWGVELGKHGELLVKRFKRKQKKGTTGAGDKVRKSSG